MMPSKARLARYVIQKEEKRGKKKKQRKRRKRRRGRNMKTLANHYPRRV